jgi:ribosomal protein L32
LYILKYIFTYVPVEQFDIALPLQDDMPVDGVVIAMGQVSTMPSSSLAVSGSLPSAAAVGPQTMKCPSGSASLASSDHCYTGRPSSSKKRRKWTKDDVDQLTISNLELEKAANISYIRKNKFHCMLMKMQMKLLAKQISDAGLSSCSECSDNDLDMV